MYSPLAAYATHAHASRGRLHAEDECAMRSVFQRDRDRILHCTAFRRLEYKTQVFVNHEGDHYRTRLTHSLEVAQLARAICRTLALDEDLAEAVALAHDLGHPPFGHAGEDGLRAAMAPYGGFDHNTQALRLLTALEQRYASFDGLNLSWETLEGVAKHNGPLPAAPYPPMLEAVLAPWDLEPHSHAGAEAQVAALADDIAYHNHDLEDGIRAGFFALDDLRHLPLIDACCAQVNALWSGLEERRRIHEVLRRVTSRMVGDVLAHSSALLEQAGVQSAEAVRAAGRPLIAFSPQMQEQNAALKAFLMQHMYRHHHVNRMSRKAQRVVGELFGYFFAAPDCLPPSWQSRIGSGDERAKARVVCDFIAGMTDRFALSEYRKAFDMSEAL